MAAGEPSDVAHHGVPPDDIRALVFDVIGTVVDNVGTTERETRELFAAAGLEPEAATATLHSWSSALQSAMTAVRVGDRPWRASDGLREETLLGALAELPEPDRLRFGAERTARLATVAHRFAPWPDSAVALDRLASHFLTVALTNGQLAQTVAMAAVGGLRWHCVFTSDVAHTYKPDPAMYQLPLQELGLVAEQTLFVAAHPWDLRAAAEHGYRTAMINRPGADPAGIGEFDYSATDLLDLADQLMPPLAVTADP